MSMPVPVMNNTKWEELRLAMYSLDDLRPKWRTKCVDNGFISAWDAEWYYHFREGEYKSIEWVEIKTASPEQKTAVRVALRNVHVPGEETDEGFRVYGYVEHGKSVDYID